MSLQVCFASKCRHLFHALIVLSIEVYGYHSSSSCLQSSVSTSQTQESKSPPTESKCKRMRASRCGTCTGCVRGDCGECKNCLDKPKFGGRGIKKQACLRRMCCTPQEESDSETTQTTSSSGFRSEEVSPSMMPSKGGVVSPLQLEPGLQIPRQTESSDRQSGMMLHTRKLLDRARGGGCTSTGYSTADEEQLESDRAEKVRTVSNVFLLPFLLSHPEHPPSSHCSIIT